MISVCSGSYNLRGKAAGQTKEGGYVYKDGQLQDSSTEERVGNFSYDPIAAVSDEFPLPSDLRGDAAGREMPCIGITDSEIMSEIQKGSSEGAYFVLPSQLNGAEYPSHHTIVAALQDYMFDNTGGPRGQLAVHPAAGQFVIDNAASDHKPNGINAIDGILSKAPDFKLVNGYLHMPNPPDDSKAEELLSRFRSNLFNLRPLIMSDVKACGLTPDKGGFSTANHKVNIVYASAVPVNAYLNKPTNRLQSDFHEQVAEGVLVAQYYGALKAAAAKSSKTKVFLMPLGGGVFNNSWESIAKSMSVAVEMLGDEHLARLDIQVLTWNGNPREKDTMESLLKKHGKFKGAA